MNLREDLAHSDSTISSTPYGQIGRIALYVSVLFLLAAQASAQRSQRPSNPTGQTGVPLERALPSLGERLGVDIAYAHKTIGGLYSHCQSESEVPEQALNCHLRGTDLGFWKVREAQYLVVPPLEALPVDRPVARQAVSRREIMGSIRDAETGEPLPGANVVVRGLATGATSQQDGAFSLEHVPPGSVQIVASFVGYESATRWAEGSEVDFRLNPISFDGDEIVVEGDRHADLANAVGIPGAVPVLERRSMRNPGFLAEGDLFQSLQWLPGVHQSGEVGGYLITRGSGPEYNLHLVDGAPLYHPWHTMGLFSTLQTDVLSDARLLNGNFGAGYGGRLSAILDTHMRDGSGIEPEVNLTFGSMSSSLLAESALGEKASVMVSARRSYEGGFAGAVSRIDRLSLQNSSYASLSAKLAVRPAAGHQLKLTVHSGRDQISPMAEHELRSLGGNRYARLEIPPEATQYRWTNALASLQHSYVHSDKLLLTSTGYYSGYRAQDQPDETAPDESDYTVRVADVGLKLDATYFASAVHTIYSGASLAYHSFLNLPLGLEEGEVPRHPFLQSKSGIRLRAPESTVHVGDHWRIGSVATLQTGLRASYFGSEAVAHLLPRAALSVNLTPLRSVFKAGMSRQVQYIHQVQDAYSAAYQLPASRWVSVAAEGVEPAVGTQYSSGLEIHPVAGLRISSDWYFRSFNNVLLPEARETAPMPGATVSGRVTDGYVLSEQRAYGLEFLAQLQRGPTRMWASYAAGRSISRPMGSTSGFQPTRYDVPHTLRAGASWTRGGLAVSFSGEARSGFPVADADLSLFGLNAEFTEPKNDFGRLPTYARLDARVGYEFSAVGATWNAQLQVFNLTDRSNTVGDLYDDSVNRSQASADRHVVRSALHGLPRLPFLRLQVGF